MNEPLEMRQIGRNRVRDGTLEIGPNELVGVEFGRIARETMKAQARSRAQEFLHEDAAMLVDVVPDDEDRSAQALEQQAQESNDIGRADVPVAKKPGVERDPSLFGLDTDR